uniref:Uncharacterized protein n=1 Tax=Lepeophtheirus salmonis TaxID=72036 RepID=A0A0K2UKW7_LEPSM
MDIYDGLKNYCKHIIRIVLFDYTSLSVQLLFFVLLLFQEDQKTVPIFIKIH